MRARWRVLFDAGDSALNLCGVLMVPIVGAVMLSPAAAHACSVCGGSPIGTDPGTGFNVSLLFLMAMPYAVVAAIAGWLIYMYRRALKHRETTGDYPRLPWTEKESEN